MQRFDYLANYLLITWLIDLQPMNKHGQSLDSCDNCFLLEANQPVWSVRPLSRNAMTCNLPLQTRKQEPARTWAEVSSQSDHGDFHTSHTSQLLFLISSITKMLVFWDVKKKQTSWSRTTPSCWHSRVSGEPDRVFLNCTVHAKKILHGSFDPEL